MKLFRVMAVCVFLKYAYCGFLYYPIMDDYIQYGTYNFFTPYHVFFEMGAATTRPAAAFFDYYIWANLPFMVSVIIIAAAHFASAVFIYRVLEFLGARPSALFFAVYLLLPTVSEAVFWLSASTRIIGGMFFASAAAYALIHKKRVVFLVLFLLSCWFYEQAAVFSAIFSSCIYFKNKKVPIIPIVGILITGAYYILMKDVGNFSLRLTPEVGAAETSMNILRTYGKPLWGILKNGFVRGLFLCFKKPLFLAGIIFAAFFTAKYAPKRTNPHILFILGAVLFLASYFPFFISGGNWISLRAGFVPAAGLAIMAGGIHSKRAAGLLVCAFLIINTTECYDYMKAGEYDFRITQEIAGRSEDVMVIPKNHTTTYKYHEHIESITAADWSLKGAMYYTNKIPPQNYSVYTPEKNAEVFDGENFLWYIKE